MNENKIKKDRQTTWPIRQVSSRAMAALNRQLWLSRFLRAANNLESEYAYIDIFLRFLLSPELKASVNSPKYQFEIEQ